MTDNTSVQRRRFLQATGGAATAAAIAGCIGGGGEETTAPPEDEGTDETGGTDGTEDEGPPEGYSDRVLQMINGTMTTLDPIAATDTASGTVIQNTMDALMNYPNGEIAVENLLADSVDVSDDYRTYTFTLKEGVQYHNGDEVTADDVVYSFERLAASDNSSRAYFILDYAMNVEHEDDDAGYVPGSLALAANGDYEFQLRLTEPFAPTMEMLAYTSFSVIPKGVVDDIDTMPSGGLDSDETEEISDFDMEQSEFGSSNPIGCGPFQFVNWESSQEAEVERFSDYHGGEALIAGVYWNIITDSETAYQYSQNLNSDLISMPTSQYDPGKISIEGTDDLGRSYGTYGPMQNGRTANFLEVATINTYYIGFNCENVEKPVRQAFAYAANQQDGLDQVFKGRGVAAYHLTPPNIYPGGAPEYDAHAENNYPYGYKETQLDQAQQVMEDAGYGPDNMAEVTFTTYTSPTWQGLGKILRDKLQSAHVNVSLEESPFSTLLERGGNGNLEAYSLGWIMDWPTPDNFLGQCVPELTNTDREGGAQGFYLDWDGDEGGLSDAAQQAADAWDTISNNPEPTEDAASARADAAVQMEEAMWEDMVLLPMYHASSQRLWYDWIDIPRFGGGGGSRQKYNDVVINERDT